MAGKVWRIGYIGNSPPTAPETERIWNAFRQELQERGYIEGNLVFERRYMEGKPERAPGFADELVRLKVDLIVAVSNPATLAAKNATSTIPFVMAGVADPVGTGLVASLARPERNITGVADYPLDLIPVAPVVAYQAQGQATQGLDLSSLAPLRVLRSRPPDCARQRPAVGKGVRSCPRAGCASCARPVRYAWNSSKLRFPTPLALHSSGV